LRTPILQCFYVGSGLEPHKINRCWKCSTDV
jgi:hypothetical protein